MPSQPAASRILDSVAAFISKYLLCDPHQLTILTLWAAYTWSFKSFRAAVYLNVRSPESQSGKSTCLMLLKELASNPSFATGVAADTFMKYLLTDAHRVDKNKFDCTIFLDECHHTFGPTERQPLLALLNSGSDVAPCYFSGSHEYYFFGPKVFAGSTSLPRSLASRCIPVNLRRKKPSDILSCFDTRTARDGAAKLVNDLISWVSRNRSAIEEAAQNTPPRIPSSLTPREQACAEPLLHIADLVGGPWPEKVRTAISNIFMVAEGTMAVELLSDLRSLFYGKNNPDYLATKQIVAALRELEHRPWAGWSSNAGKKLGGLLHPLGITSRYVHRKAGVGFRAYFFKHFQDAWERYLPPITVCSETETTSEPDSETTISNNSKELIR